MGCCRFAFYTLLLWVTLIVIPYYYILPAFVLWVGWTTWTRLYGVLFPILKRHAHEAYAALNTWCDDMDSKLEKKIRDLQQKKKPQEKPDMTSIHDELIQNVRRRKSRRHST